MDPGFWHERWKANQIAFHEGGVSPILLNHLGALAIAPGSRVFVPLCGKTLSIAWLLANGFRVAGAELSEIAIEQLFAELGASPTIVDRGKLRHFSGPGLDVYVGDILDLDHETLGAVDAVFDRAALVALPGEMRRRYAAHTASIAAGAPQLLATYEYDQSLMNGPPFSVPEAEVRSSYEPTYEVIALERSGLAGGIREVAAVQQTIWHLNPHSRRKPSGRIIVPDRLGVLR